MIMGVVYTLAVTNFQRVADESQRVGLDTLRVYLHTRVLYENNVKFICLDDCSSCRVFADGKVVEELNGSFDGFLDESIKVYRYDISSGVQEITKEIYFNSEDIEESVCFSYTVDKKGVGDQVFIEFKNRVYDYTSYFSPVPTYKSVEAIVEAKESLFQEVSQ